MSDEDASARPLGRMPHTSGVLLVVALAAAAAATARAQMPAPAPAPAGQHGMGPTPLATLPPATGTISEDGEAANCSTFLPCDALH